MRTRRVQIKVQVDPLKEDKEKRRQRKRQILRDRGRAETRLVVGRYPYRVGCLGIHVKRYYVYIKYGLQKVVMLS